MNLTLVAAIDKNLLIGKDNNLPWYLPADLKIFKKNTLNKDILMGRKTCESLKRPLPKRTNWVLTRQENFEQPGFLTLHDWRELPNDQEIMVIGGAVIFELLLPYANKMILTHIDEAFIGDTYFPKPNWDEWTVTDCESHPVDETNPHYSFKVITYYRD